MNEADAMDAMLHEYSKYTTLERVEKLDEVYKTLNKKFYICGSCMGHTILDKNEETRKCKWCGKETLQEESINFVPLTFGQIKKKDTMEINGLDIGKHAKKMLFDEMKKNNKWFISNGVIRINTDDAIQFYDFRIIDDDSYYLTHYQYSKDEPTFAMLYSGEFHGGFNKVSGKGVLINPVLGMRLAKNETNPKEYLNLCIGHFLCVHMIFNYLASKREIEEVRSEVIKGSEKEVTTRSGKTITKKRRVIYITDSIKIYTYDNSIVNKLREHKPIMLPFWKVREFKRRVFAKEDKALPMDQRRVIKVSNVPAFLKGRERHKHTLDECQIVYKIAR